MAEKFYTILTNEGKKKLAIASISGLKLEIKEFALGDGDGKYYEPTEEQTELKKEVWRTNVNTVGIDDQNPSWIKVGIVIPAGVGGFTIREAGIFDSEGDLIAVGKYPETYKPIIEDGAAKELTVDMIFEVSNADSVELNLDSSSILATKKDLEELEKKIGFESKTYDELKQMIDNKELVIGKKYLLTDYRTKYQQPITLSIKESETEPLLLTAISVDKLDIRAYSAQYPNDVIEYDFNNNKCEDKETHRRGFIIYRRDSIKNNSAPYDFRKVLFVRYYVDNNQYYRANQLENFQTWTEGPAKAGYLYKDNNKILYALNSDVPTNINDDNVFITIYHDIEQEVVLTKDKLHNISAWNKFKTSNKFKEFYTFDNTIKSCVVDGAKGSLSNNIFIEESNNNVVKGKDNTFIGDSSNNTVSGTENIFTGGSSQNNLVEGCNSNWLSISQNNVLYHGCTNNFINQSGHNHMFSASTQNVIDVAYYNSIGAKFNNNIIPRAFTNNVIYPAVSNNTFGKNMSSSIIAGLLDKDLTKIIDMTTNQQVLIMKGPNNQYYWSKLVEQQNMVHFDSFTQIP